MECPAQSPDLNPIEHLWGDIKYAVSEEKPTNAKTLWDVVRASWAGIRGPAENVDLHITVSGPKMLAVQNYHGNPAPPGKPVLTFQTGEVIELLRGDPDSQWWEGRSLLNRKSGYFPSSSVKPCPVQPVNRTDYSRYPWFAGNVERPQADNLLKSHLSGTYLIRERPAEAERFAISIKFNDEVKHIKVVEKDSWIHITEAKKFESLLELVEYYQTHSLKESFKQLDTTLKYPYKLQKTRSSPRSPVFTPRPVGTAIARYNFAARDMRELSLREGDVVKIYSRIGGDQGWWKGETNGKSPTPSSAQQLMRVQTPTPSSAQQLMRVPAEPNSIQCAALPMHPGSLMQSPTPSSAVADAGPLQSPTPSSAQQLMQGSANPNSIQCEAADAGPLRAQLHPVRSS
ncbi:unnamed protein product [Ranitomeya imitator]|uniref:Uncharacterized protein n=1 Tax=Ranitomeya imitator TaxID=111125 RepID=A0ABN9KXN8_9NEOB|nr:unnamed protein product [Ranitomeya imitator]